MYQNDENLNLAAEFVKYTDDPKNEKKTVDDFFDEYNIPSSDRSDFAIASILVQATKILEKRDNKEEVDIYESI